MRGSLHLFFIEALRALSRNLLRSSLAALSITIGIAAVVAVVAIGRAGSRRAEQSLQNLGNNFVWIEAGSRAPNGVRSGSHGTTSLTLGDAEAIGREIPLIRRVTPNVDGSVQIVYGHTNWHTHWRGVNPDYFDIKSWQPALGEAFTDEDVRQAKSVCVLGATVREQLFGSEDPVGKTVRVQEQLFQVVGVLAAKGQSAFGSDQDDTIVVPWSTGAKKIRGKSQTWLDDILASAVSPESVVPAIEAIADLLRQRHHLAPGAEDDFNIRRPDEFIKAQIETSHTLEALLLSIASISLLVGGIGVMNVMLVSITQRTREIGVRLAVGATSGAVQLQFLGEAVVLTLLGGLLGIGLGAAATLLIGRVLGWDTSVPLEALLLAPLFSAAVGVFFGLYPARVASRLDPIASLRHE